MFWMLLLCCYCCYRCYFFFSDFQLYCCCRYVCDVCVVFFVSSYSSFALQNGIVNFQFSLHVPCAMFTQYYTYATHKHTHTRAQTSTNRTDTQITLTRLTCITFAKSSLLCSLRLFFNLHFFAFIYYFICFVESNTIHTLEIVYLIYEAEEKKSLRLRNVCSSGAKV